MSNALFAFNCGKIKPDTLYENIVNFHGSEDLMTRFEEDINPVTLTSVGLRMPEVFICSESELVPKCY